MTYADDTAAAPRPSLLIRRMLDAPRELVFQVWTQAEHLAHWWGPRDFTVPLCEIDVRPGGAYRIGIRRADGVEYRMRGQYREIVPPERLVFTFAWEDEHGQPEWETLVTVTFAAHGKRTELTFHQTPFESVEDRDSHNSGWNECFDRLDAYLAGAR